MVQHNKIYDLLIAIFTIIVIISLVYGCKASLGNIPTDQIKPSEYIDTNTNFSLKERLGKLLFFDTTLSTPPGQACANCHDPKVAFADPLKELPVSKGAHSDRYGNRNDMPASYAAFVPPLQQDRFGIWFGGLFWDGRANTLAEQAMGPPLNPLEMANPDTTTIAEKLRVLEYADLFTKVYGADALLDSVIAYKNMADAIEAYERTSEVNPFSSKYDYWLQGKAELNQQELRGLSIFEAKEKGQCAECHPNKSISDSIPPLFTDFKYNNVGAPKNPENPFYTLPPELNPDGFSFVDLGLGATVDDSLQNGKFRTPTLRNVAITSPYMHNGIFKTIFQVLAFYNTRDIAPWPEPEVKENLNREEMGNLKLTNVELEDLAAFLETLTDGWNPGEGQK